MGCFLQSTYTARWLLALVFFCSLLFWEHKIEREGISVKSLAFDEMIAERKKKKKRKLSLSCTDQHDD